MANNKVNFFINGEAYSVSEDNVTPSTTLVDFIRDEAGLKGTKFMCREGGCGACVVSVKRKPGDESRAMSSCLCPVLSCDGFDITTVEKLGTQKTGYHLIQKRLRETNGTQCGYCTPGFVMNMYSLLGKDKLTAKEIEEKMDGNICRCTGYRPILDAFKSFASDAPEELKLKNCSAEDIENCFGCPVKSGGTCCKGRAVPSSLHLKLKSCSGEWIRPLNLTELFTALDNAKKEGHSYRLVAGNSSTGIFKKDGPYDVYIDINSIPESTSSELNASKVSIGGGVTLTDAINHFKKASEMEGYEYTNQLGKHIKRVANNHVRNAGTLAGNLMIKYNHREFPSDIFALFECIGVKLRIASAPNLFESRTMSEFLGMDMKGKLIISITLPSLPKKDGYSFHSYKITQRYQNSHAYVNAAMLLKLDSTNKLTEKPSIVYGGIHPQFTHPKETENYLNGKSLGDSTVLQEAMRLLDKEVVPDHVLPDASPQYRKNLAKNLFYKTVLKVCGEKASSKLRSGGECMEKILTRAKQVFETDQSQWPLNQPGLSKLEAESQISGTAEYVNDIHKQFGELFGAFVLSTVGGCEIDKIDTSLALSLPGVVKFVDHKDIPGSNETEGETFGPAEVEEIFSSGKILWAGQPIGLIVAIDREIAYKAADLVKVTYKNQTKPILTIKDSIKQKPAGVPFSELASSNANSKHTIKGEFEMKWQYHNCMENHSCLCIPKEDGIMEVYPTSQWMTHSQQIVANALKIPHNQVIVNVKRLGGGYGAKITKVQKITGACAVAANATNKPVRISISLEENMKMIGKRLPYLAEYEVGFDDSGKITENKIKMTCDTGCNENEGTSWYAKLFIQSCYTANKWNVASATTRTTTHPNTWTRAPGSTEAVAIIENIINHIAKALNKDPDEIRAANYIKAGDELLFSDMFGGNIEKFEGENYILRMMEELRTNAAYENRKKAVKVFNEQNRWKKRGMAIVPIRYAIHYFATNFNTMVAVYFQDGSVACSHAGIEMGQGINTKVAQVIAKTLGIPLEKVKVRSSNNFVAANSPITGGAISSELACHSAMKACQILNERIKPFKEKLGKDATWEQIVLNMHKAQVDLTANYRNVPEDNLKGYSVWGITLTEVEVDMLTGEYKICRMDLIEDCGKSLSIDVDIGQIEGALIMGIGYWTSEKMVYNPDTAELLTNNTWNYKVPLAGDIPEILNITMLKNVENPNGVLRSKATGEPPTNMGVSVLFALRNALDSARKDAGAKDEYYQIDGPCTVEDCLRLSLTDSSQFTL